MAEFKQMGNSKFPRDWKDIVFCWKGFSRKYEGPKPKFYREPFTLLGIKQTTPMPSTTGEWGDYTETKGGFTLSPSLLMAPEYQVLDMFCCTKFILLKATE